MKRALADAETVKTDLIAQARAESDRMLQKAKEQIEREKKLAIQELRSSGGRSRDRGGVAIVAVVADPGRAAEARARVHRQPAPSARLTHRRARP